MAELIPVPMTDRNGKVTTRRVRFEAERYSGANNIPSPDALLVEDREMCVLFEKLLKHCSGVSGARSSVVYLFRDKNMDALRALEKINDHASNVVRNISLILAIQDQGGIAHEVISKELIEASNELKWKLVRACRQEDIPFPAGGDPPGWDELCTLLLEDQSRYDTLLHMVDVLRITDHTAFREEMERISSHGGALQEGVL